MGMDLVTFFLGTGVALFIALLAWGDNIRKPAERISDLEEKFRLALNVKKRQINPILRQSPKYSFIDTMSSLITLYQKKKAAWIPSVKSIKQLQDKRKSLEKIYSWRYFSVIITTILCFALAFLSYYFGGNVIFLFNYQFALTYNTVFVSAFFCFIIILLVNLVFGYIKEEDFAKNILEAFDKIEA